MSDEYVVQHWGQETVESGRWFEDYRGDDEVLAVRLYKSLRGLVEMVQILRNGQYHPVRCEPDDETRPHRRQKEESDA